MNNLAARKRPGLRQNVIHEPIGGIFLDIGHKRPTGIFRRKVRTAEHLKRALNRFLIQAARNNRSLPVLVPELQRLYCLVRCRARGS